MPTKHIKAQMWNEIHEIALRETIKRKTFIKESEILEEVILEGLKVVKKKKKRSG